MINKKEIIKILEEIGTFLELKGENPFKSRAYYNAARTLQTIDEDIRHLILNGEIERLKGIGKAIAQKLYILVSEGKLPYYEELKKSIPEGLTEMLRIPGLGPKKVKEIYEKLNITTIGELEYACQENRLRDLSGFGEKSQQKILESIALFRKFNERFHYPLARAEAEAILKHLQSCSHIGDISIAGSLRRKMETVKDVDIVAICPPEKRKDTMEHFISYEKVLKIIGKGNTKSSVILQSGLQCDLRLVEADQFPFALHHFTGSKEHNTAMRQRAKKLHLTMNEYGLFPQGNEQSIKCVNEEEIFKSLGLVYIPPELREGRDEIEMAERGALPQLVETGDIQGILHVHTTWSDGSAGIEEMAEACRKLGYSYLGISDHSKSAFYANGLSEERLYRQEEEINRLNESWDDFVLFKGIEVDILQDGSLDYSDEVLAQFDFVIASVHSGFKMSEEEMTARICRALKHPLVTILGHPTGRLLLGREPYPLDMGKVLETAAGHNKVIEINANPHRLDMDWRWGDLARKLGVKVAVNPDAHMPQTISDVEIGIGIARKGGFEAAQVINTYNKEDIRQFFSSIKK